jgi:hypothetical protein
MGHKTHQTEPLLLHNKKAESCIYRAIQTMAQTLSGHIFQIMF